MEYDEILAIYKFIGKTSPKEREGLGLSRHHALLLSEIYNDISAIPGLEEDE